MQLDKFLSRVLPTEGTYYLIKGDNANRFTHKEHTTTTSMSLSASELAKHRNNIYFSTGSFNPGTSRTGNDVLYKKSFYLDLDCGAGKDFATKQEALMKFKLFQRDSGIVPPSIIVDSGNGIHIYWVMDKALPVAQWTKVATLLKDVCAQLNFAADPAVTADAARILRAPDTVNNKSASHPKECKIIHSKPSDYTAGEFLGSIKQWASEKPKVPSALADVAVTDDLVAGMPENRGPKYFKYGKDECLIMQDMINTGGSAYNETAWMQAIGLLTFCEDGHDYIHKISEGHTTYSEKDTEMKWRVRLRGKEAEKFGPVLCKTLNNVCPGDLCSGCPHNGRVKSPITLCRAPHSDLEMPYGYYQTDKGIYFKTPDEDESDIFIHHDPVTDISLCKHLDERGEYTTRLLFDVGRHKNVQLDVGILADRRAVHRTLAGQQVIINLRIHPQANMVELMNAWSQQLNASKQVTETRSGFGWIKSGKRDGFSIGETTIWSDGTETPTLSMNGPMISMYSVKGDIEKWKEAAQYVIAQGRQPINAAIASAFAAPLVKFTDVSGVLMSLVSKDSGAGKSMALSIAAAVWGNPQGSISTMNDTVNSMNQKMGTVRNLPGYWDEIRMMESFDSFAKTLFQLCEGKEKARLNQNATRRREATWQTMTVAASNESLIAHVDGSIDNSNAGRMRLMEFSDLTVVDTPEHVGVTLSRKVRENYGGVGRLYADYLVKNKNKIGSQVADVTAKLYKKLKASNDERFWVALIATTLVGASIANSLKVTNFDTKRLQTYLFDQFRKHRSSVGTHFKVGASTASDYVNDFINANTDHGITYEDLDRDGNTIGSVIPMELNPTKMPVKFEYGAKSGRYKIIISWFKKWLVEQNKRPASVMSDLEHDAQFIVTKRARVGMESSGTRGKVVPVLIVEI